MKLRIRYEKCTERIELDTTDTLKTLKDRVESHLKLSPGSYYLSLNGKDELDWCENSPLVSFDIVSGDLITVVCKCKTKKATAPRRYAEGSRQEESSMELSNKVGSSMETSSTELSSKEQTSKERSSNKKPAEAYCNTEERLLDDNQSGTSITSMEESGNIFQPMLIQDSTNNVIPMMLRTVFVEGKPKDQSEVVVLICHILLCELGFSLESSREEDGHEVDNLPHTWRKKGSFWFKYIHDYCETLSMEMLCVPIGKVLVVHAKVTDMGSPIPALQLKPSDYIGQVLHGYPESWQKLSVLSQVFKDNFAYPVLAAMRQKLDLPVLYSLISLMPEIQLKILTFLNVHDMISVSAVSKHLYSLANDSSLWKRLFLKDFSGVPKSKLTSWKNGYIQEHRRYIQEHRCCIDTMAMKDIVWMPPSYGSAPQYRQPEILAGIRGGRYDLDPFAATPPPSLFNPGSRLLPNAGPMPGARFDPVSPFNDPTRRPGRDGGRRGNPLLPNNRLINHRGGFF